MSTVCAAKIVVVGTLKRGAFGFERRRSKLEWGCSATVYCENPEDPSDRSKEIDKGCGLHIVPKYNPARPSDISIKSGVNLSSTMLQHKLPKVEQLTLSSSFGQV